jgi:hypothetical protein
MDGRMSIRILRAILVAAIPFGLVVIKAAVSQRFALMEFIEAGMHATYLGAFTLFFWPQALWQRMPVSHRTALAALVVLMLWGQINQKHSRQNFPFIAWNMYTPPAPEPEEGAAYTDVVGVTDAGETVDLDVVELFPPIRNGFRSRLGALIRDKPDEDAMNELLSILRDKHNSLHPEKPVREVQLKRIQLPVRWEGEMPQPVEVDSYQ